MKKIITIILSLFSFTSLISQVGIGTTTPDSSAVLDISSNTKGLLLPRLTSAQRDAIVNPKKGLTIFNTTTNNLEFFTTTSTFLEVGNGASPTNSLPSLLASGVPPYFITHTADQSFTTPSNVNSIESITVQVSTLEFGGNFRLRIFSASTPTGTVIASKDFSVTSVGSQTIVLTNPITVTPNQVYTFSIEPISGTATFQASTGNFYSGGQAFSSGNANTLAIGSPSISGFDLIFSVKYIIIGNNWTSGSTSGANTSTAIIGNGINQFSQVYVDTVTSRIGIGTTTPKSRLSVSSTNAGSGFANWISADFGATTGERVVVGLLNAKPSIGGHSNLLNAWTDLIINGGGGNVGIGTETPVYTLEVNGRVAGVHPFLSLSDKRFKTNVQPLQNPLQKILALKGISFYWDLNKAGDKKFDTLNHIGFLAQDVEKILPQVVNTANDANKTKTVAYSDIVPVLVEAIKEQQGQIEKLKRELQELKKQKQ